MKQHVKLHIGAIKVQLGFWTRLCMWLSGKSDLVIPFNSIEFNGLDIELGGETDPTVSVKRLDNVQELVVGLAKFAEPYVKQCVDKVVADITR